MGDKRAKYGKGEYLSFPIQHALRAESSCIHYRQLRVELMKDRKLIEQRRVAD